MTVDREASRVQVDPVAVMEELNAAAIQIDDAARELRERLNEYDGGYTRAGEFRPGIQLRWLDLVGENLDRIVTGYEDQGKRPPAREVVQSRAERAAKQADEELWARYHYLDARIANLQRYISAKAKTIGARQSILRGERT